MTKKKTKQAEARRLEVEANNRKIKELREKVIEIRGQIKQLIDRNDELKETHSKKKWDDTTPLYEFVKTSQADVYYDVLKGWQPYLKEKIGTNVKKHNYFKFDLMTARDKAIVIRYLKKAQTHAPKVFTLSERALCSYLSKHSNLGSASCIRKALQRCDLKKWGQNNKDRYVPAENTDV